MSMQKLVGNRVLKLYMNDDFTLMVFVTDGGEFAYETVGDCCSHSWFEAMEGVDALLGFYVDHAESIDLPNPEEGDPDDYVQSYGIKLTTARGWVTIEFRNRSNGYYGGDVVEVTPPRGYQESLREVTEDFQGGV